VKGGGLARALAPARILTLVLSDVVGDDLDVIASGPTVPDPTTYAEAQGVLRRRGLEARVPRAVMEHLTAGADGDHEETPKPGDPIFARSRTLIVGNNRIALEAAAAEARNRGYKSLVLSSRLSGEARELAHVFVGIGMDIAVSGFPLERPACLIAGGETTVTLRGQGRGGRNQEMALAFLDALRRSPSRGEDLTFLAAGTDGNDGPTEAAGAYADRDILARALSLGADSEAALADNDSNGFFGKVGALLLTGPTRTNVCDIHILLVS
jgi:hydroxypyruvate reductase